MAETISKRIVLHFPNEILDKPIVYILVKDYDLVFNILKAFVVPDEEGLMVMELSGTRENLQKGLDFLKTRNVRIEPLRRSIVRLDDRCYQCGLCTGVCPSGALALNRPSMEVVFDSDKCVLCGACVDICPSRAMKIEF